MNYDKIYGSITVASSDKKIKHKITLQSKPIISNNINSMLLKHTKAPIVDINKETNENNRIYQKKGYSDVAESNNDISKIKDSYTSPNNQIEIVNFKKSNHYHINLFSDSENTINLI